MQTANQSTLRSTLAAALLAVVCSTTFVAASVGPAAASNVDTAAAAGPRA